MRGKEAADLAVLRSVLVASRGSLITAERGGGCGGVVFPIWWRL